MDAHAKEVPRRRRSRLSPDQRAQQLLDCAIRVFAKMGLGSGGHSHVAHAAHVAVSTVFIYFPTREALVDAVIAEVDRYLTALLENAAATQRTATNKLLAITRDFSEVVDRDPDYIKIWLNWSTEVDETTWARYVIFQDRILASLSDIIELGKQSGELADDVKPLLVAHLVMGAAHMIAQMKFRGRTQEEIDEFLRVLIRGAVLPKP